MNSKNKLTKYVSSEYLTHATKCYKQLKSFYEDIDPSDYWSLGCTLDSIIDFLNIAVPAGYVELNEAQSFLHMVADNYTNSGDWYDDWGWWGNATGKVFDSHYNTLFGDDPKLQEKFKAICQYCFNYMKTGKSGSSIHTGAPQVYNLAVQRTQENENKPDYHKWQHIINDAEPFWNIGCWQYNMSPSFSPFNQYPPLGPFQVTVVNALYYVLTQRVLSAGYSTPSDVNMMTEYFCNWMNNSTPGLAPEQQLFNRLSPTAGLFRERVSIYKNGKHVDGYDKNLAWTGDQGLMLSALTIRYNSDNESDILDLIKAVIYGVFNYSIGNNDHYDNVVMPWSRQNEPTQPGTAPDGDEPDYSSGTGVFMRGLLHASAIPEIKSLIASDPHIQTVLTTTANLCVNNKYPYPSLDYGPHEYKVFKHFNELTTLLAASKLIDHA